MTQTFQDRQRDAAMERVHAQTNARREVVNALNLMPGYHAGDVIHLTPTTAVVQVAPNNATRTDVSTNYTVVHDGKPTSVHVETLELALLLAVQIMAGGRAQDDDYVYAGRVLRVAGS